MKILVIGDFHGKFPSKLKNQAKKVDLVVSVGDYLPFSLRKEFFEFSYHRDKELWEVLGKKKVKAGVFYDLKKGKKIFKILNELSVPVFSVIGNVDQTHVHDVFDLSQVKRGKKWKWYDQDFFSGLIKKYKNIKRIDYGFAKFGKFIFIGAYGHTFPGYVKSKNYKRYRKKLERLFKKFRKENKEGRVIFVSHNVPYDTKLDKITSKDAPKKIRGKHYGSKLVRRIINKHQPLLAVAGHIHENFGKDKIGKTIAINSGSAAEGEGVIIDVEKANIKSIKFLQ